MSSVRDPMTLQTSLCGRIDVIPLFFIGYGHRFAIQIRSAVLAKIFRHDAPADVAVADKQYSFHSSSV
jgi:hypothetical protein